MHPSPSLPNTAFPPFFFPGSLQRRSLRLPPVLRELDFLGVLSRSETSSRGVPPDPRLRENNFDLLRLVFAAVVMVFHVGALSGVPWLWELTRHLSSHFAVKCFFFISGFLVLMSCEKSPSLRSYAEKRIRRIAPAYLFIVVGAALLLAPLSELPLREYFASDQLRRYLVSNLLLMNFLQPTLPGLFASNALQEVNGSLWTIKIEVAFYALVPVILWLSRRAGRSFTFQALLAASLAWRVGLFAFAERTGNPLFAKLALQAPGQLCFFITGAMAFDRTRLGLSAPPAWAALLGALGYGLSDGVLHELVSPFAVALFCSWAAVGVAKLPLDVNKRGDISYGLYILHWPVGQAAAALGLFQLSPLLGLAAAFGGTVTLSYLSWHLIESRFLLHRRPAVDRNQVTDVPLTAPAI